MYNETTAIGLQWFPVNTKSPVIMFIVEAKDCSGNDFLDKWKPELLHKLLRKGLYSTSPDSCLISALKEDFNEGQEVSIEYWKTIALLYSQVKISFDKRTEAFSSDKQKQFKKEILSITSKILLKKILLKEVNCTKYLKSSRRNY